METPEGFEERVNYRERYQGSTLNFLGRPVFLRYDCCEFVKCIILIDERTEKLAITNCIFEDCNIDTLSSDDRRFLIFRDNVFKLPIEERRTSFEKRLAEALAVRGRRLEDSG
jgi:hypothetical protein